MENTATLPQAFEIRDALSQILVDLLGVVDLDGAYLSRDQREGNSGYRILTFLTSSAYDPLPQGIYPLITRLGKEHPDFKIKVYTPGQAELALAWGSLYFLEHCCLGRTIYGSGGRDNPLDFKAMALESLLERAARAKKVEMRKVEIFAETAKALIKTGDHAMATYNMHQAMELAFRFIQKMGMGMAKVTHSIITHIKYTKHYFPTLEPFAQTPDAEANELLMLLEHAYSGARYGDDFEITQEQVQKIKGALELFIHEIDSIFTRHLDSCREWIKNPKPDPTENVITPKDVKKGGNTRGSADQKFERAMDGDPVLETLKLLKSKHFKTLRPHSFSKNAQSLAGVSGGYLDNAFKMAHILKVCMLALDSQDKKDTLGPSSEDSIRETLGSVLELIPYDEMEFLDIISDRVPGF